MEMPGPEFWDPYNIQIPCQRASPFPGTTGFSIRSRCLAMKNNINHVISAICWQDAYNFLTNGLVIKMPHAKNMFPRPIFHNPNLRFNPWGNPRGGGAAQVPFIVNALSMVVSNWESTVFSRFFRRRNPKMRGLGFVFPSETDVCCFGMIWNPIFLFPFSKQY